MVWKNHLKLSDPRSDKPKWPTYRSGDDNSTFQVRIDDEDFEVECTKVGVMDITEENQDDENEGVVF
jgi:hypothetical protein